MGILIQPFMNPLNQFQHFPISPELLHFPQKVSFHLQLLNLAFHNILWFIKFEFYFIYEQSFQFSHKVFILQLFTSKFKFILICNFFWQI